MGATDVLGDMFTVIRNGIKVRFDTVRTPSSRLKKEILKVMKAEGFIKGFNEEANEGKPILVIDLKYGPRGEEVIHHLKRVSTPGRRIYRPKRRIPRLLNGLGVTIVTTPKGVMTGYAARRANVGGEILCEVY